MLILNRPKVGAAGGALGTACLPGGKRAELGITANQLGSFLPSVEGSATASPRSPRNQHPEYETPTRWV
jgi:hypothetical protein